MKKVGVLRKWKKKIIQKLKMNEEEFRMELEELDEDDLEVLNASIEFDETSKKINNMLIGF